MHDPASPARHVRFGAFALDLRSGELRKGPTRLKVPDQSIEILKALLEQPGELVTREQLRDRLWPADTFVDFEHGLNAAVRRLREALGDSADTPRFIETLPRRGYRFVGAVDAQVQAVADRQDAPTPQVASAIQPLAQPHNTHWQWTMVAASAVALFVVTAMFVAFRFRSTPPRASGAAESSRLTFDAGYQTEPTFSPDSSAIAYTSDKSGNFDIWQQPLSGGNAVPVTNDPAHDSQPDWSPDGSRIAFRSERNGGGIFVAPATGGDAQQITNFGYRPRWSPDGSRILFRASWFDAGGAMYLVSRKGEPPRQLAMADVYSEEGVYWGDLDGGDGWHPSGRLSLLSQPAGAVRLLTFNPDNRATSRYYVGSAAQTKFRDLGLRVASGQDLAWASDGTALYFVGISKGLLGLWVLPVNPGTLTVTGGPHRLATNTGPNRDLAISRDGQRIAYSALTLHSRVWLFTFDRSGKRMVGAPVPVTPEETSAESADLTTDGRKLLYLAGRPGSNAGLQLRSLTIPDGPNQLFLSDDRGNRDSRNSPRWSPDGTSVAYVYIALQQTSSPSAPSRREASIRIFDLRAGDRPLTSPFQQRVLTWLDEVPTGWSPDGQFVITPSRRYKPDHMTIALLPVSAGPDANVHAQFVTSSVKYSLWNASMSPNGRWLCFNAVNEKTSRLAIISASHRISLQALNEGSGEWTWLTDGTHWADKPRWSADGRLIYFVSQEGGLGDVWGLEIDPIAGSSIGLPFRLTGFTGPGLRIGAVLDMGVGGGRLAIRLINPTGNIWMLENFKQ